MSIFESKTCPLCGLNAEFTYQDNKHEKFFECENHKSFVITKPAEQSQKIQLPEIKRLAIEWANKAPENKILEIGTKSQKNEPSELVFLYVNT